MARRTTAGKLEEVQDLQSEPAPPREMDLVGGLAFVAFLALLAALVLAQLAMKTYLGKGLFAG
jgi:hypothetical protein